MPFDVNLTQMKAGHRHYIVYIYILYVYFTIRIVYITLCIVSICKSSDVALLGHNHLDSARHLERGPKKLDEREQECASLSRKLGQVKLKRIQKDSKRSFFGSL